MGCVHSSRPNSSPPDNDLMLLLPKDIACHRIADPYLTDREVRNWAITSHYHITKLKSYMIKQEVDLMWFGKNSGNVIGQPQFIRVRDTDLVQPLQLPMKVRQILVPWNVYEGYFPALRLTEDSVRVLLQSIKQTKTLNTLILKYSNIDDEGTTGLAECIKLSKTMTVLDFSMNTIGDAGAIALGEAIKSSPSMVHLDLFGNQIGLPGAISLSDAIKISTSMTYLNLTASYFFDDDCAVLFGEAIKYSPCMRHLDLGCNEITDRGACAIGDGIKHSRTMVHLALHENEIGDIGCMALADGIKAGQTMTTLILSRNEFGDDGAVALAEAINSTPSMTHLNVRSNRCVGDGSEFERALTRTDCFIDE